MNSYKCKSENILESTTENILNIYEMCFFPSAKRKVRFRIVEYLLSSRVFISIENGDGKNHYTLKLTEYLKFKGFDNLDKLTLLENYGDKSLRDTLQAFFNNISSKLDNEFEKFLMERTGLKFQQIGMVIDKC